MDAVRKLKYIRSCLKRDLNRLISEIDEAIYELETDIYISPLDTSDIPDLNTGGGGIRTDT